MGKADKSAQQSHTRSDAKYLFYDATPWCKVFSDVVIEFCHSGAIADL
jgi:hypothetical protein